MDRSNDERLYSLLPAIYRTRDAEQGETLRALLAIVEQELANIETDIEGLYDDWFIETCAEWVVPYIADLLGVRNLHAIESAGVYSQRAYVANALRYRRRKGTLSMIEQLARDVTGWPAHAVEFFQLLATSQHLNHLRPDHTCTPDLRSTAELESIATPFETTSRTVEVRRIASERGKYNIANIGLFLWRLQAYKVTRGTARAVSAGCYTFCPLGLEVPLFNPPQPEADIAQLAEEINVPGILRRRTLYDELEGVRQALVDGRSPHSIYFSRDSVFRIFVGGRSAAAGNATEVPPEEILICDLSTWRRPPAKAKYCKLTKQPDGAQIKEEVELNITAAVDPELGRIAFPAGVAPQAVHVSYAYAFGGEVGAGPYDRQQSLARFPLEDVNWQVGVSQDPEKQQVGDEQIFTSLAQAVKAWNALGRSAVGVIAIMDSCTYAENLTGKVVIDVPAGSKLLIVAADWPIVIVADSNGQERRKLGRLTLSALRPYFRGNISCRGTAPTAHASSPPTAPPGELTINGLLIQGSVRFLAGNLGRLQISHCTIVPDSGQLVFNPSTTRSMQNEQLRLSLYRTITPSFDLPNTVRELTLEESVVVQTGDFAISAAGSAASIHTSTVLGRSDVLTLEASNSIFYEPITVKRKQVGCVRFCYVPEDSHTPRRYHCQPDSALEVYAKAQAKSVEQLTPVERAAVTRRLAPTFTSLRYGNPGFAQLSCSCAEEICTGAEDGAEMGVFHYLQQPQREANLRASLDEYLRFGLDAGILYVT